MPNVCAFLVAALRNYHQLDGFETGEACLSQFWSPEIRHQDQWAKIKMLAGTHLTWRFKGRICSCFCQLLLAFLGSQLHRSSLCLHLHITFSSWCVCILLPILQNTILFYIRLNGLDTVSSFYRGGFFSAYRVA